MMSKKFIKILCVFLAALMLLSGIAVLANVFSGASAASATPTTGVQDIDAKYLIAGAALCLIVIIVCIVLPKLKKKDAKDE